MATAQTPSPLGTPFNNSDLEFISDRDLVSDSPPEYMSTRVIPPSRLQSPELDDNTQSAIFRPTVPIVLTMFNPTVSISQQILPTPSNMPAPQYTSAPIPPPAVAPTATQSRTQLNVSQVTTMEMLKPFKGDEDKVQDPQTFLHTFNCIMRLAGITDAGEKIEVLQDYIIPRSEAQKWYNNLTTSQRISWTELNKAFNQQWEPIPRAEKTLENYQEELLVLKLKENKVGKTKETNGTKVWTHVIWAREALRLATAAGVESNMGLVRIIHKGLPKIIRKLTM
ncbi:hypothetical protein PISMIDRAFT_11591 [Pisolithus microcarpus 441]|uniref:Retrotransposon gag domain-containing protein n=1 Tax=Pisolithus microcarpus 441 TaxID=765257 RepID=A0A0C9ZRP5_9AGAM|nr:hypothetical protein PISMIDRAFT_11591 [Pisolithus microcarpus 441]